MTVAFFHPYGFVIGLAIWLTVLLIERKSKQIHVISNVFWSLMIWECVGGVIGARLYHVATDFSFYQHQLWHILFVWQGGLSILGAGIGCVIAFFVYQKTHPKQLIAWRVAADLAVFGIPFGQAIGRWGNYLNQELYGLPTHLPWGIYIDIAHRLPGYQAVAVYHPLFLYEMLLMLAFGTWIWWWERKKRWQIGQGRFFWTYFFYYLVVRFALDFLRIDKTMFFNTILSVNQVVLLFAFTIGMGVTRYNNQHAS